MFVTWQKTANLRCLADIWQSWAGSGARAWIHSQSIVGYSSWLHWQHQQVLAQVHPHDPPEEMFQLRLQYCSLGPLTLFEMVPVNSAPSMAQTSLQIGASALILLALIQIMLLCCQLLIRQKQSMCYLAAHGRKVWWQQSGCIPIAAPRVINRLTFLENSVALCSLSSTLALSTHWSVIYKQPGAWKRTKHTSICKLQGALLTRCLRFHIRHRMKTIKRTKSEQNKMNLSVSHPPPSSLEICILLWRFEM